MLPKTNRIRKKEEYQYVFRNSKKIRTTYFDFYFHFLPDKKAPSKLGIIISNDYGKANKRNLIRRRIRDILHKPILYDLHLFMIIRVKKEAGTLTYNEIREIILQNINLK